MGCSKSDSKKRRGKKNATLLQISTKPQILPISSVESPDLVLHSTEPQTSPISSDESSDLELNPHAGIVYPRNLRGLKEILRKDSPQAEIYIARLEAVGKVVLNSFLRRYVQEQGLDPEWELSGTEDEADPTPLGPGSEHTLEEDDPLEVLGSLSHLDPDQDPTTPTKVATIEPCPLNSPPNPNECHKQTVTGDGVAQSLLEEQVSLSPPSFISSAGRRAIKGSTLLIGKIETAATAETALDCPIPGNATPAACVLEGNGLRRVVSEPNLIASPTEFFMAKICSAKDLRINLTAPQFCSESVVESAVAPIPVASVCCPTMTDELATLEQKNMEPDCGSSEAVVQSEKCPKLVDARSQTRNFAPAESIAEPSAPKIPVNGGINSLTRESLLHTTNPAVIDPNQHHSYPAAANPQQSSGTDVYLAVCNLEPAVAVNTPHGQLVYTPTDDSLALLKQQNRLPEDSLLVLHQHAATSDSLNPKSLATDANVSETRMQQIGHNHSPDNFPTGNVENRSAPSHSEGPVRGKWEKTSQPPYFHGNRRITKEVKLNLIPNIPKDVYKFSLDEVVDVEREWSATLIGALVGSRIPLKVMKNYIEDQWQVPTPKLFIKDNGVMVFKFNSEEDRLWVLEHGPWLVEGNKPLILKEWKTRMAIDWSSFRSVPVWVKILDIDPMLLSSNHMLEVIGNMIGKPISIESITYGVERLSYARLLVEVTSEEMKRTEVVLESYNGILYKHKVTFEWMTWHCELCNLFGRTSHSCSRNECGMFPTAPK